MENAQEIEIWKDIEGFEGYYQVSNFGQLKSLDRFYKSKLGNDVKTEGRVLKPSITRMGYKMMVFSIQGKLSYKKPHRLVAIAFIPNPENKPQVNHKDGNKLNNHVSNLEWATSSENVQHAFDTGLKISIGAKGSKGGQSKLTDENVLVIRKLFETDLPNTKIGKMFNVSDETIRAIRNGKSWNF